VAEGLGLILAFSNPTLLGLAAIVSSVCGALTGIVGMRRASKEERDKANEDCLERLKVARAEAEEMAEKLHEEKMRKYR
jgi:hypothetical protein